MDEDAFAAVITLLSIFLISCVICIFCILKFSESIVWHGHMVLFAMVIISGTMSISSLIIALREARINKTSNIHDSTPSGKHIM